MQMEMTNQLEMADVIYSSAVMARIQSQTLMKLKEI
jgi:hypothetical protein